MTNKFKRLSEKFGQPFFVLFTVEYIPLYDYP